MAPTRMGSHQTLERMNYERKHLIRLKTRAEDGSRAS